MTRASSSIYSATKVSGFRDEGMVLENCLWFVKNSATE